MPEIMPWVIYMLTTQSPSSRPAWFARLLAGDQLFVKNFAKKLPKLKKLKQDLANEWNDHISDFVFGGCSGGGSDCLREAPDDDRGDCAMYLSLGSRELRDPLYTISVFIIPSSGPGDFCCICAEELSKHARDMVGKMLDGMSIAP